MRLPMLVPTLAVIALSLTACGGGGGGGGDTPTPTNAAPVVAAPIADQSAMVGEQFSLVIPAGTFTDPNNDPLTITVSGLPDGLSFSPTTRTISGIPTVEGSYTVAVIASDPAALKATDSFVLVVAPATAVNQPPTVANAIPDQNGLVGTPFSFAIPANTFADAENDPLSLSVSGLPVGLSYEAASRTISGTPTAEGSSNITVTADDGKATVSDVFALVIAPAGTNVAPTVAAPIADMSVTVNTAYSFTIPAGTFTDVNGDELTITVSGLPAGLSYDVASMTISGTPTTVGDSTIMVMASDGSLEAMDEFVLMVKVANRAPVVASPLADQPATVGTAFSFVIPSTAFSDPDGDNLTYSASGLPAGISFNATTRTFSGTPTTAGAKDVTVTATDPAGLKITDVFKITVAAPTPTNRAPVVANPIADQTAVVNTAFSFVVPSTAFSDPDGDTLTYTVSGLPAGISFDAATRTFSGSPTAAGASDVTVTAKDPAGLSVSDVFKITVTASNTSVKVPANGTIDNTTLADGYVTISFPGVVGDDPTISSITVPGGSYFYSDLDPAPAAGTGAKVYLPREGIYTFTVTVSDPGDTPETRTVEVATGTVTGSFVISGDVKDGAAGSEVGVSTNVELYWQPMTEATNTKIETQASNASTGAYSFGGLLGDASAFQLIVKGGTNP